jgi:hypothetical protein
VELPVVQDDQWRSFGEYTKFAQPTKDRSLIVTTLQRHSRVIQTPALIKVATFTNRCFNSQGILQMANNVLHRTIYEFFDAQDLRRKALISNDFFLWRGCQMYIDSFLSGRPASGDTLTRERFDRSRTGSPSEA